MNNPKQQFHMVIDCDEVLVKIYQKWITRFANNTKSIPEEFKQVLINSDVNMRSKYELIEGLDFPESLRSEVYTHYFDDKKFYDDLEPSLYYFALASMYQNSSHTIGSMSILTNCGALNEHEGVNISKKRFLLKLFKDFTATKLDFYFLNDPSKKSECINQHIPQYTTFVDDSLGNIEDVILHTNSKKKEFLIPLYGYNQSFQKKGQYELEKELAIVYFKN
jgi:hypothetical protein